MVWETCLKQSVSFQCEEAFMNYVLSLMDLQFSDEDRLGHYNWVTVHTCAKA